MTIRDKSINDVYGRLRIRTIKYLMFEYKMLYKLFLLLSCLGLSQADKLSVSYTMMKFTIDKLKRKTDFINLYLIQEKLIVFQ